MSPTRRVFVAGSSGFIGRALCEYVDSLGHKVFGVDRDACENQERLWSIDLLDADRLSALLAQSMPEYIFHTAGLVGSNDETALYLAHVETTKAILTATRQASPLAKVIVLGSAAEYGVSGYVSEPVGEGTAPLPQSLYGRSKLAQSEMARQLAIELDLDLVRVRLFNTLGPGQGPHLVGGALVKRLYRSLSENAKYLEVYDPFSERDYLDIRDVARLLWFVAENVVRDPERVPIHIASGKGTAVIDLARWLLQIAGVADRLKLEPVPGQVRTRLVGEPVTLAQLTGKSPIQRFSLYQSLCDMWEWETQQRARNP